MPAENIDYKQSDHLARTTDYYALAKYDITKRWLAGFFRPGMRLLNIGCGGGEFNQIAVDMGFVVLAVEPELNAFNLALSRSPAMRCEVDQAGVFDLDPVHTQADVIVMHDVLEHIEDDGAVAKRLSQLLKPGGKIILSVPALQCLFGFHDTQLGHYRRYRKENLERVLSPWFKIRRIRYFGMTFIPVTLWFSRIRRSNYPVSEGGLSLVSVLMKLACTIESYVPTPVGTSVIVELDSKSA